MADHYGSTAGFAAWNTGRGITAPAGDVEAALVRASFAIDAIYESRWVGDRASWTAQLLAWPRANAQWPDGTAISGIPVQLEYATYEAALLELRLPGSLSPVVTPGSVKKRARVEGAVEVEYAYNRASSDLVESMRPVSLAIEGLLTGLVSSRTYLPGVAVV